MGSFDSAWVKLAAAIIVAAGAIVAALIRRSAIRESRSKIELEIADGEASTALATSNSNFAWIAFLLLIGIVIVACTALYFAFQAASKLENKRAEYLYGNWTSISQIDLELELLITKDSFVLKSNELEVRNSPNYSFFSHTITLNNNIYRYSIEPDGMLVISIDKENQLPKLPIAGEYIREKQLSNIQRQSSPK